MLDSDVIESSITHAEAESIILLSEQRRFFLFLRLLELSLFSVSDLNLASRLRSNVIIADPPTLSTSGEAPRALRQELVL